MSFVKATLNDVGFRCTTLEKVRFMSAKMEAKMDFKCAKCIDCEFANAHVTGMERVQNMQFAPIDIPKPKTREPSPWPGSRPPQARGAAVPERMEQLQEDIVDDIMDEFDIEAGGDADADGNDADDDAGEEVKPRASTLARRVRSSSQPGQREGARASPR